MSSAGTLAEFCWSCNRCPLAPKGSQPLEAGYPWLLTNQPGGWLRRPAWAHGWHGVGHVEGPMRRRTAHRAGRGHVPRKRAVALRRRHQGEPWLGLLDALGTCCAAPQPDDELATARWTLLLHVQLPLGAMAGRALAPPTWWAAPAACVVRTWYALTVRPRLFVTDWLDLPSSAIQRDLLVIAISFPQFRDWECSFL